LPSTPRQNKARRHPLRLIRVLTGLAGYVDTAGRATRSRVLNTSFADLILILAGRSNNAGEAPTA
jgi:hypothetical protein